MTLNYFVNSKTGRVNSQRVKSRWLEKRLPEFLKMLENTYPEQLRTVERIYLYFNNLSEKPTCKHCGSKNVKFKGLLNGYFDYCSTTCSNANDTVKKNKEKSVMQKYGVRNPFQADEVKKKISQTCVLRYNTNNFAKTNIFLEKAKATNNSRYAANWVLQKSSTVRNKINERNAINFKELIKADGLQLLDWSNEKFGNVRLTGSCNHTFALNKWQVYQRLMQKVTVCPICNPFNSNSDTNIELIIKKILEKNNIEYISGDRNIIKPQEVDIFIPENNVAIEINGVFWHSDVFKSKDYHFCKTELCRTNGVKLLHIWEDQILNQFDIIESIILSKLGKFKARIYARNCKVLKISAADAKSFLTKNHLQGHVPAKVYVGLFYKNELIAVSSFGKLRKALGSNSETDSWELYRFASKLNVQIIGGAGKMIKFFKRLEPVARVISFASADISDGAVYEKIGFSKIKRTGPSYWYIEPNTNRRFHRYSFRKDQLVKNGANPNLTEFEIMNDLKYLRIWDSGQFLFELK